MPAPVRHNVFYLLLIPAGLIFTITVAAYGYMAFVAVNAPPADAARTAVHPLWQWMRVHGNTALLVELVVLGLITVGVIATDGRRQPAPPREKPGSEHDFTRPRQPLEPSASAPPSVKDPR